MRLNKSEEDHIKAMGPKWNAALAAASLVVRKDDHLVGLDKIREPLAYSAALRATAYPEHVGGFVIPRAAGSPHPGIQEIVDRCFAEAVKVASVRIGAAA